MNEYVRQIVEGFGRLTAADQIEAYVEIDAIWKGLQDDVPSLASWDLDDGSPPAPNEVRRE
jgi:hypothetical protein